METPICDFVSRYVEGSPIRLHMPGHKGTSHLGCEARDITEIPGADVLSAPQSIILESENNATALFGTAHTFYSTEGSSQCIRAMLSLVATYACHGRARRILAARNVHKAMIYAAALLDLALDWIYPTHASSLCSCPLSAKDVEAALEGTDSLPLAVYLTSPDYLGQTADIAAIAKVCHARGVLLLVDNAHGAYLQFLKKSQHPIALGADLCCDSAHKTLPVLTGGAYLQVSNRVPPEMLSAARTHLALFGSTSPSYLILQSLDLCNRTLAEGFSAALAKRVEQRNALANALTDAGYVLLPSEPLKLVIDVAAYGYTGEEFAAHLSANGIEIEYADVAYAVLMLSTDTKETELSTLLSVCQSLPRRHALPMDDTSIPRGKPVLSLRDAVLAEAEEVDVRNAEGRICATPTVSCPPAIPIAISGEQITREHVSLFLRYGIDTVRVVK